MIAVRRLSLVALVVAAACSGGGEDACPGEPVGSFLLEVSAPEDAAPSACTAEPPVAEPPTRIVASFEARLTTEASATGSTPAALCPGGRAATYYGARAADGTYALEASSGLAVLERCGPNCAVSVTEQVIGVVAGEGAAATFSGTLVERFEYLAGQCGDCPLPCSATYSLTTAVP
jgi:hypothetical protein